MMTLSSRLFVTSEYSIHRTLQVQDEKNKGNNELFDMLMKGHVRGKSTPSNRSQEKIMCHEILELSSTFTETFNRVFDNITY